MEDKYLSRILESKEKDNRPTGDKIEISEESRQAFIRAMKIGYYKAFYKQGLLTAEQLEMLIEMNTVKEENAADKNTDNNGNKIGKGGIIFCLKQKNNAVENSKLNKLQPYYLVYVKNDGSILYTYERSREILDIYKALCLGKTEPIMELCNKFNNQIQTQEGMELYSKLLKSAIKGITSYYQNNLFNQNTGRGGMIPTNDNQIKSDDDFELITWLIIDGEN